VFLEVLDLITNGVCITNDKGTILYVNQAFCDACKYDREELIGNNPRVLKSNMHKDSFYAKMWNMITNGQMWRDTIINKTKDGELYTDRLLIAPIQSKENKLYFACTRYNIDETDRLMEKLEQIVVKLQSHFEDD